jgi:hypothetical protein
MITAAEELWLEGKLEGKLEIIDNLLKAGIGWDFIAKATGMTFQNFQEITSELQKRTDRHSSLDQSYIKTV